MRKTLTLPWIALMSIFSATQLQAQGLEGSWQTIDDKTGSPKAILKINKESNGTYSATVVQLTSAPGSNQKKTCIGCPSPYTNKPIVGLKILTGLKENTGEKTAFTFSDGKIVDPSTGNLYSVKAKLNMSGQHLYLKGYMGDNALARSQTWIRSN